MKTEYALSIAEFVHIDEVKISDLQSDTVENAVRFLAGKSYVEYKLNYIPGNLYGCLQRKDRITVNFWINRLHVL